MQENNVLIVNNPLWACDSLTLNSREYGRCVIQSSDIPFDEFDNALILTDDPVGMVELYHGKSVIILYDGYCQSMTPNNGNRVAGAQRFGDVWPTCSTTPPSIKRYYDLQFKFLDVLADALEVPPYMSQYQQHILRITKQGKRALVG